MKNCISSGSQTIYEGEYDKIKVSGSLTTEKEIKCKSIHISGSTHFNDNFICTEDAHFSGSIHCSGNLQFNSVQCSGSIHTKNLNASELSVSGSIHCQDSIQSNYIKVSGSVYSDNINSKILSVCGKVDCSGNIIADDVCIKMHGVTNGNAKSIKAKSVNINHLRLASSLLILFTGPSSFTTSTIEGDNINIDYVTCDYVCGKNVKIGKHCNIKKVEYTDTCNVSKNACVSELIKK